VLIANTGLWCVYNLIFVQEKYGKVKVDEEGISLGILLLKMDVIFTLIVT
jgi:hypothetical protein